MAYDISEKLLRQLREQVNALLAGSYLLNTLVEEKGGAQEALGLAAMNKTLYSLLRTLSHLELAGAEDLSCHRSDLDLAGLCETLCREVASVTAPLPTDFRWSIREGTILASGDRYLLSKAILNLLTNAFEAGGEGGHVTLECDLDGEGRCRITVRNDGRTTPPPEGEDLSLVKEPGGLGLGLKVAQRIAQLHGGTLVLRYSGKEAAAVLILPLTETSGTAGDPGRDLSGGFSEALVEFSPLLPAESFGPRETE